MPEFDKFILNFSGETFNPNSLFFLAGTYSCNYSTLTQNKKSSGTTVYDLLEKEKNKKKKFSNKNDNKSGSRSLLEKLLGNN